MSSYIDSEAIVSPGGSEHLQAGHSWQAFTDARMAWLYGPDHASERAAKTRADIEAWNRLGRGKDAA